MDASNSESRVVLLGAALLDPAFCGLPALPMPQREQKVAAALQDCFAQEWQQQSEVPLPEDSNLFLAVQTVEGLLPSSSASLRDARLPLPGEWAAAPHSSCLTESTIALRRQQAVSLTIKVIVALCHRIKRWQYKDGETVCADLCHCLLNSGYGLQVLSILLFFDQAERSKKLTFSHQVHTDTTGKKVFLLTYWARDSIYMSVTAVWENENLSAIQVHYKLSPSARYDKLFTPTKGLTRMSRDNVTSVSLIEGGGNVVVSMSKVLHETLPPDSVVPKNKELWLEGVALDPLRACQSVIDGPFMKRWTERALEEEDNAYLDFFAVCMKYWRTRTAAPAFASNHLIDKAIGVVVAVLSDALASPENKQKPFSKKRFPGPAQWCKPGYCGDAPGQLPFPRVNQAYVAVFQYVLTIALAKIYANNLFDGGFVSFLKMLHASGWTWSTFALTLAGVQSQVKRLMSYGERRINSTLIVGGETVAFDHMVLWDLSFKILASPTQNSGGHVTAVILLREGECQRVFQFLIGGAVEVSSSAMPVADLFGLEYQLRFDQHGEIQAPINVTSFKQRSTKAHQVPELLINPNCPRKKGRVFLSRKWCDALQGVIADQEAPAQPFAALRSSPSGTEPWRPAGRRAAGLKQTAVTMPSKIAGGGAWVKPPPSYAALFGSPEACLPAALLTSPTGETPKNPFA